MFLSILVPVYNAQSHLRECLDSLLEQDIRDYEIVCVDDGSRDDSPAILDAYARAHPCVRVLHQENRGVAEARNAALAAAQGEYIWFVDADDLLLPNCLAALKALGEKTHCQRLVVGGYQFTDALTQEEQTLAREGKLPINVPWQDAVVWRNLLRRDFLLARGLTFRYPELTHGEDGLYMYEVGAQDPDTTELPEILYFYRVHAGSAETSASRENRQRKIRSYIRITGILRDCYQAGRRDATTANKCMSFLWMALYEAARLPAREARQVLDALGREGLFPFRPMAECSLDRPYLTEHPALDRLCAHLHTRWGFALVWLLWRARR